MESKKKVLLGMSGGVDSSISAYLLKEQGYEVVGVTVQMKPHNTCGSKDEQDAKDVASKLNIEHHLVDMRDDFKESVIEYFISEYEAGRTPNPCVVCNRYVKFEALLQKADELNIQYVATGHYAQVQKDGEGRYLLKKAIEESKDQSYMLYKLTQQQLSRAVFPLGEKEKSEVREIAKELGFTVADKPDSQEVCFIDDNDYHKFLEDNSNIDIQRGNFVDLDGNVLGEHEGITKYTVGQRRGLGISMGKPTYVVSIDIENNEVVLGDEDDIFKKEFTVKDLNTVSPDLLNNDIKLNVKIRYRAKESPATIELLSDDRAKVIFDTPQRAITPGQSAVFYKEDIVVAGGVIE